MANILTIKEALIAVKRDIDYGGEIKDLLPGIDAEIAQGTGIAWHKVPTQEPYLDGIAMAKNIAKLILQIDVGLRDKPIDIERKTYKIKQLQVEALLIAEILNGDTESD